MRLLIRFSNRVLVVARAHMLVQSTEAILQVDGGPPSQRLQDASVNFLLVNQGVVRSFGEKAQ